MKIGTAIILMNEYNEILLGKRLKENGYGYYAAPGGTIEENEYPLLACVRECKEETNFSIRNLIPLGTTNKNTNEETVWFFSRDFDGELQNREPTKCEEWLWLPIIDLPNPLWNGLKEILKSDKLLICLK